jgi:hypothetical protein
MNDKTSSFLLMVAVIALATGGCMNHEVQRSDTATTPVVPVAPPAAEQTTTAAESGTDVLSFPASMGTVSFPHKMHQELLKECSKCHEKGPGKIEGFGKDWAHTRCKGCHQEMQRGPTACNGCHKK